MKTRLLSCLCLLGAFATSASAAEPAAAPVHATTTTKSAIKIGNGSFALVKGTKLVVLGREGDQLMVKFRSTQGKVPLADTDFPADTPSPAAAATPTDPAKPASALAKPVAPVAATPTAPGAKAATPPALSVDGKPASTYGKAVQKAKQVTETQKSTRVNPTKDIMDDEPKE